MHSNITADVVRLISDLLESICLLSKEEKTALSYRESFVMIMT